MSVVHLAEGDVLEKDGFMYRVLCLLRTEFVVFNINAPVVRRKKKRAGESDLPAALPEIWRYDRIIGDKPGREAEHGYLAPVLIDSNNLTDAERRFNERALPVLEFLGTQEPFIYYPDTRAKLVAEAEKRFGFSRQTIFKILRSYWQCGKNVAAVISGFRHCGAPGVIRIPGERKRGRPRSLKKIESMGEGVNVGPEDQNNVNKAVLWYRANTNKTFEDAYLWMLGALYGELVRLPDGRSGIASDERKVMTFSQFYYHARRMFTESDRLRRAAEVAKGSRQQRRRFSGNLASQPEVGETAETDALRVNASFVSEEDRALVLGSAVVFLVVEYASGIVMGLSLGWDGEDYETFVDALVNCVVDKQEFCASHGIEIEPHQWPVNHLAQRLHADRGSATLSALSEQVAKAMQPNPFANAPPYSAEAKGRVENTVQLFKTLLQRILPGAWVGKINQRPRGTTSPHKLAVMTRAELMKVLLEIVLEVNARVRARSATRPDLVARGVASSPCAITLDALATHRHRFRRVSSTELQKALLPRVTGTVTEKGIYVGDELYYIPERESDLASEWYLRLEGTAARVEIARDRRTVDKAFLCPPGQRALFVPCILTGRSKIFSGMSLSEVQAFRRRKNEINDVERHRQLPVTVARHQSIDADVQYAVAQTRRAIGNVPYSQRDTGNRRENRAAEKAAERPELNERLDELGSSPQAATPRARPAPADNFAYPDMDDF